MIAGLSASQDQGYKKDGKWNPNKKRGPGRPVLTLGGKNKVEKARRRKAKRRMRKKLGQMEIHSR